MGSEGFKMYIVARLKDIRIITAKDLIAWCERENFPNEMNFFIPSTSGVHGSYCTLNEIEENIKNKTNDYTPALTIMLFKPRIVQVIYGSVLVDEEDIPKLREIISKSWECLQVYYDGNVVEE